MTDEMKQALASMGIVTLRMRGAGGSAWVWEAIWDGVLGALKVSRYPRDHSAKGQAVQVEAERLELFKHLLPHHRLINLYRYAFVTPSLGAHSHLVTFWE